jgi:hypothetical protein
MQIQKWRVVTQDVRLVQGGGYYNKYGTMSLLLIDQLPNYRRRFIILIRMQVHLFALEMATRFLTLELSLT